VGKSKCAFALSEMSYFLAWNTCKTFKVLNRYWDRPFKTHKTRTVLENKEEWVPEVLP
jgi:hypothetical protein